MVKSFEVDFYDDGKRTYYDVSFDTEEMKKLRDKLVDEFSIRENHRNISYSEPIYTDDKKYERFEIRHLVKDYLPGIDVWPLIRCQYEKLIYPYVVRLINLVLNDNDTEALKEIIKPVYSREYIPIQEMMEEYSQVIVKGDIYNEQYPTFYHNYPYEINAARENFMNYVNLLTDKNYKSRFVNVYMEVGVLLDIKEKTNTKDNKVKMKKPAKTN